MPSPALGESRRVRPAVYRDCEGRPWPPSDFFEYSTAVQPLTARFGWSCIRKLNFHLFPVPRVLLLPESGRFQVAIWLTGCYLHSRGRSRRLVGTSAGNYRIFVADSCTLQKCRAENACTVRLASRAREVLPKCPTNGHFQKLLHESELLYRCQIIMQFQDL